MRNYKSLAASCFLLVLSPGVASSEEPRILRVEEDWELVVSTPNPLQDSPQISTWMSPTDTLDNQHFGVDFNHVQKEYYPGGGFQTKALDGISVMEDQVIHQGVRLSHDGELLQWTQVMAIINQELVFSIKNGTSQSWGSFGGPDSLVRHPSSLNKLNGYSPNRSAEWSGVGFASNRVALLKLVRVRYFDDQGQIFQSTLNLIVQ